MKKTFNFSITIEMTDKQAETLDMLINTVVRQDAAEEVLGIYLSMVDVTNSILNTEYCPIILLKNTTPSDDLYETIKEKCEILPEYICKEELLPSYFVTLWAKEE